MNTKRIIYVILLGLTIVSGLVSRSSLFAEDSPVHQYVGDALWALAVFWALVTISPRSRTSRLVIGALIISFVIEATQLYHADWIDHLRSYRLGALVLGHSFQWADLACYTAGVWFGANIDHFLIRQERQSPWNWWLSSTIKDKLIVLGSLGMVVNAILFLVNLVELRILGASVGALFIGLMMRSEDSTDI
jgi:hypothetical protein